VGYGLDGRGFESRQWMGIFLFTTVSRPALGPTQPPIQWVSGDLSLGIKRPGREADYSLPSRAEVKNSWRYISAPQYAFMASFSVKKKRTDKFTLEGQGEGLSMTGTDLTASVHCKNYAARYCCCCIL
jgi:hypothetical protein